MYTVVVFSYAVNSLALPKKDAKDMLFFTNNVINGRLDPISTLTVCKLSLKITLAIYGQHGNAPPHPSTELVTWLMLILHDDFEQRT